MDQQSLERIRKRLVALREELLQEGAAKAEPTSRDGGGEDEDGQPLSEMLQVIASKRNQNRARELARINAALLRLDEQPEDFGLCLQCEEEIAPKRLEAMPFVELCLECQATRDAPRGGGRRHLQDFD